MYIKSFFNILKHPCNKGKALNTITRLIWWKCNQLWIQKPTIIELEEGARCICYPDSSYAGMVVYTKFPEYYEMQYIKKHLRRNSTFVDIGANIGVYTLLASSKISEGKIFAIEPASTPFGRLCENIKLNGIGNRVSLLNIVMSNRVGKEKFIEHETSELSHINPSSKGGILKKSISLDELLRKSRIKKVDILKVDVEGGEGKVFNGALDHLKRKDIKKIVVELNKKNVLYGTNHNQIGNLLQTHGYTLRIFNNNGLLVKLGKNYTFNQNKNYNIIAEA